VDAFFVRFGPMAVAAARFVAGVRVVVAFVAGTTRMEWGVFVRYNVLGAAAWATSVSLVGYAVGRGYSGVATIEGRVGSILLVAVPVIVVAAWALLRVRRRLESETHAPPRPMASSREPLTVMTRSWRTILLASAAFVVTFVAVAEEVSERDTDPFDAMVRGFALAHQTPALTTLATALSFTGSALVLGAVTLAAIAWLWQRGARREGMTLFVSGMLTLAGVPALKLAFHRTRPAGALLYERLGYSFPSGHAMSSMALALTMTYLLQQQRVVPKGSVLVAVLFSLCVGVSRICLDVHWASDVVGGWSIGFGIAAACTAGCEWSASRNAQPIA
jgi:undecaprenyl-diphosphatase